MYFIDTYRWSLNYLTDALTEKHSATSVRSSSKATRRLAVSRDRR
jgi:hypothetical protein